MKFVSILLGLACLIAIGTICFNRVNEISTLKNHSLTTLAILDKNLPLKKFTSSRPGVKSTTLYQIPYRITLRNTATQIITIKDYDCSQCQYHYNQPPATWEELKDPLTSFTYSNLTGDLVLPDGTPLSLPLEIAPGDSAEIILYLGIIIDEKFSKKIGKIPPKSLTNAKLINTLNKHPFELIEKISYMTEIPVFKATWETQLNHKYNTFFGSPKDKDFSDWPE